jgi:endonuclease-3 related protein
LKKGQNNPDKEGARGTVYVALKKGARGAVYDTLGDIYEALYEAFGPQHWWPGESPFEVAVGAILTQNTNWGNVEKAIGNLKADKSLRPAAIHGMDQGRLAGLIRPAGYFNVKAKRLKAFIDLLMERYGASMKRMKAGEAGALREELLSVNGIGPETADSILLYALEKPVFVVDAYTRRVLSRHGIMKYGEPYGRFQELLEGAKPPFEMGAKPPLREEARPSHGKRAMRPSFKKVQTRGVAHADRLKFFNEYHALFVRVGKTFCRRRPLCGSCPLGGI